VYYTYSRGIAVAQWLRCCATIRKVAGSIPAGVSGFYVDMKSRSHHGPGVDSACNGNEYQEYFLGVRKADNLPPSCAVFMKSGNLNFLEPSGPVQACNGSALPFTHTVEPNYISPSSTVGIQLNVSNLYVDHLQVVI